ncbi:MAG: sigma-70 family RNA polymerase sigma factor [Chloroflexota bacterium]|nr:sigma-70 family RNA polymerase sigma factor [Chloroflexota bacterium]
MSDSQVKNDAQLVKQAKQGDVSAFGELYDQYAEAVYRFLHTRVNTRMDAEDLTSEVFLRAWRSLSRYRHRGYAFSAYLFQIARNLLIDYYRRSDRVEAISEREMRLLADEDAGPSDKVVKQLEHEELRETLEQLREDYRTVLMLRFVSGFSSKETAEAMERSSGAVRVLQHRALNSLKELLQRSG